jgi:hypothetical protein
MRKWRPGAEDNPRDDQPLLALKAARRGWAPFGSSDPLICMTRYPVDLAATAGESFPSSGMIECEQRDSADYQQAGAAQRSLLTLLRDRESDPATRVRKSNASPGACAVAGPLAFFALFAVENLADRRGGLRAVGPGITAGYGRRSKEE